MTGCYLCFFFIIKKLLISKRSIVIKKEMMPFSIHSHVAHPMSVQKSDNLMIIPIV